MNQQERVSPGTAVVLFHRSCGQYKTLPQNAPGWHCIPSGSASQITHVSQSCDKPAALQGNHTEWHCILAVPQSKEDSWKCCPEGWRPFQESCYYFSGDQMPWDESQQNCSGMGSQLVVINTEAEQEFLFSSVKGLVTNTYETKYYMGLSAHKTGKWQWVDRTPYKKMATFWKPGEPNLLFAEKCAAIHVKGNTDSNTYSNWNNILCSTSCYRICELAVKFV
nr:C-type lectin domain family 6 member A-like isoform X4 [Anas platyrhynchos]